MCGCLWVLDLHTVTPHVYPPDADAGCILAEGVQQFCQDLDVDPMDIVMVWHCAAVSTACASVSRLQVVISWHFGAETMCEFSHEEFVRGMAALRCVLLLLLWWWWVDARLRTVRMFDTCMVHQVHEH